MSRIGTLECPDFILIDLDPQECPFAKIVEAALLVRTKLDALGLEGYPKTTGGDGMHIYVPIENRYTYEEARSFAEVIARLLAAERPDLFTTPRSVAAREKNRVYFDYLQIAESKTISAPYVARAYPGAPVSTPLRWEEVMPGIEPTQFNISNTPARFARVGDLFAGTRTRPQRLENAFAKLEKLVKRTGLTPPVRMVSIPFARIDQKKAIGVEARGYALDSAVDADAFAPHVSRIGFETPQDFGLAFALEESE